jgi:hypothetical protein
MVNHKEKLQKLLDKSECLVLLCSSACNYWSFVKFLFSIPLVLTSSAMCIINSISEDANAVKIPNIVVNAVSVLIVSLNNSIKASEKAEGFKKLSQQFMSLTQEIDTFDDENIITTDKYNMLVLKYDNLINDCSFEEIPTRYKLSASKAFSANNRAVPIQLNGVIGNNNFEMSPKRPAIVMENI